MTVVKRVFKGKDVEMLTVIEAIARHAIAHKQALQARRSTWADPYFENFLDSIISFTENHYGKDAGKKLREATEVLNGMYAKALVDLGDFKLQLKEDFKAEKTFVEKVLKDLGFSDNFEGVRRHSQEALVDLLYAFKQNMSPELKAKIVEKGTSAQLIDDIVAMANTLRAANVSQEMLKEEKKDGSSELVTQLNAIYDEGMKIAKMATKFLKAQGVETTKFNYSANLQHLTGAASAATVAKKAKAAQALQPA